MVNFYRTGVLYTFRPLDANHPDWRITLETAAAYGKTGANIRMRFDLGCRHTWLPVPPADDLQFLRRRVGEALEAIHQGNPSWAEALPEQDEFLPDHPVILHEALGSYGEPRSADDQILVFSGYLTVKAGLEDLAAAPADLGKCPACKWWFVRVRTNQTLCTTPSCRERRRGKRQPRDRKAYMRDWRAKRP